MDNGLSRSRHTHKERNLYDLRALFVIRPKIPLQASASADACELLAILIPKMRYINWNSHRLNEKSYTLSPSGT